MENQPRAKRLKVCTACDICRVKKIKCDGVQPECGPCRAKYRPDSECTWTAGRSRNDAKAYREHIEVLQQHIKSLEQSTSLQDDMRNNVFSYNSETPTPSHTRIQRSESSYNPSPSGLNVPDTSLHGKFASLPTAINENISPASAMVGSVETNTGAAQEFYGGSSASNFMTQIRQAVAQQLGDRSYTTNTAPFSSLGMKKHSQRRKSQWQDFNFDDCVLPPKSRADALMSVYLDAVHPLYPFIDRVALMESYESLFTSHGSVDVDPSLLCALNLIFALSCQLDTTVTAEQRQTSANVFFRRAQNLLDIWKLESSLESVQVLLLLGQYLQSTNEPLQCWVFVGAATRMAQSLGLHLAETSANVASIRQREILRRIWHACILMDRVLAMTYGRPTMISQAVASVTPLPLPIDEEELSTGTAQTNVTSPSPSRLEFFLHSLKLYEIMEELLNATNSNIIRQNVPPKFSGVLGFRSAHATPLTEIDDKLVAWEAGLPDHLRRLPDLQSPAGPSSVNILYRQAVILRQRLLHVRLLSLRPVLSSLIAYNGGSSDNSANFGTNLSYRIAHQCAIVCIKVAQEAIDLVHQYKSTQWATTGFVAAWWYNVLFVYSAATVLVAARVRPLWQSEISETSILQSWRRAIDILETYKDYSKSIPKLIVTLQMLFKQVPKSYLSRDVVNSFAQNSPAQQIHLGANDHEESASDPQAHRSWDNSRNQNASRLDEVGRRHDEDFDGIPALISDIDFFLDADDLSWLNSGPIDL